MRSTLAFLTLAAAPAAAMADPVTIIATAAQFAAAAGWIPAAAAGWIAIGAPAIGAVRIGRRKRRAA